MIIPIEQVSQDTLFSMIESYVLREGTDYGENEISLNEKVQQVHEQLQRGEVVILYSELHETFDIVLKTLIENN